MADNDLRIRFGVGHLSYKRKQRTRITYKSPSQITSPWISENCSSVEWYQNRGEGVLVLRSGVNSIGGGESAEYSPFYGQASVTEVVLPEQITTIGDYAFDGCTNLDKVVITSEVPPTLGDNVFEDTTTVYVPYEYLDTYEEAWGDEVEIAPIGDYYQITVTAGEHGSATGSGWYALNESVTLTATADEGYEFTQWNDGNTDNPRTITVLGDATYTAAFQEQVFGTVSYTSTNEATGGWVTYNTDTTKNTYDSMTHEGVLYLKSGAAPLGGGQSTDYSPFYTDTGLTAVDLSDTPFTSVGSDAFNGCTSLSSVVLPTGVTVLGNQAFRQCTALTSITIPNSVTTLGNTVFNSCSGATSLSVGNGLSQIGTNCFTDCSGLASITVASGNTTFNDGNGSNCIINTSTNELVLGCKNTVIPNTVTKIGTNSFRGCSGLTSISIPSSVTSFGTNVFQDCTGLTSVNIPDTVTSFGTQLFYNCTALASVNIPTGVTTVPNSCFRQCSALTSITIPSGITSINDWAFRACSHLTSVTCEATTPPTLGTNNFNTSGDTLYVPAASVSAYQNDASWSAAFTTITAIPTPTPTPQIRYTSTNQASGNWVSTNTDTTRNTYDSTTHEGVLHLNSGVTSIGGGTSTDYSPFYNDTGLTSVDLDDAGFTTIGESAFDGCTGLASVTIGSGVTTIGEYAFVDCSSLTSINIPSGVTSIGGGAFGNCGALASVTLPSGLETIGATAFGDCGLTSIIIPNTVSTLGDNAFSGCTALTSFTCGAGEIGQQVCYGCTDLATVTLTSGVTSIGQEAFKECYNLTSVTLPNGLETIDDYAFSHIGVTSVTIPSTVTYMGYEMFSYCDSLESVTISEGVTEIGTFVFQGCYNLASLSLPSTLTTIGECAFSECTGLTSVTIPSGVTSIGASAFYCENLVSVTCNATTPPTLDRGNFTASGDTLYIPYASLSAYQNDSEWSAAFDTIRPIGNYAYITVCAGANGSASGSGWYAIGATATMTATPDSGYEFTQWNDGNTSNPRTITVSTDATYTAAFQALKLIRYTSTNQATGTWVSTNTDTTKNTYDPTTHEGVLYLNNGVTKIGGGNNTDYTPFYQDAGLTSVDLTYSGLTNLNTGAFRQCSSLTSIYIPANVSIIVSTTFYQDYGVTSITVDPSNTTFNDGNGSNCIIKTSNNELVFGCRNTVIPNTVVTIGEYAFSNCTGLSSIDIPSGVTEISQFAFSACSNLTTVTCLATTPPTLGNGNFGTAPNDTLYVPAASVSAYQNDASWSAAFTTITAIPTPTPTPQIRYTSSNEATGTWVTTNTDTTQNTYDSVTGNGVLYLNSGVTSIGGGSSTNYSPFYQDGGLTAVDLDDAGLTTIGESAFESCSSLTSVDIPSSVTTIGGDAFRNCIGLTSATIGSGVTSIGGQAFRQCTALTSITIPNSVTSIGANAFQNCTGLTSATIGNGVTTIGNSAFSGCSALTSLTIGSGVTTIGNDVFDYCASLTSINIPSSVTSMGETPFYGCTGLASITVDSNNTYFNDGNGSNCIIETSTNTLTTGCKNTVIPNTVTTIGIYAFYSCSGLTSIDIPSSVTAISSNAFRDCSNLTSVTCEATTPPTLGNANFNASNDTLYVPLASVSAYQSDSSWNSKFTTITHIPLPPQIRYTSTNQATGTWVTTNTDTTQNTYDSTTHEGVLYLNSGVTSIGGGQSTDYSPFYQDTGLTSVDLTYGGLTTIGNYAFDGCTGLASITIPNNVTSIGTRAFDNCSSLTSFTIPSGVTSIGIGVFRGCTGLTSITIPNSVTSIRNAAFADCSGLTSVTIGSGVTIFEEFAFRDCTGLTSINIPSSVTSIGYCAFNGCTNLTSVTCEATTPPTLANENFTASNDTLYVKGTSVSAYQNDASWSAAFTTITAIPLGTIRYVASNEITGDWITVNTDTTQNTYDSNTGEGVLYLNSDVTSIGGGSAATYTPFRNNTDLTYIDFSDSKLTSILGYTCNGCTNLTKAIIGESVTTLGTSTDSYGVFEGCSNLTSLEIGSNVTVVGKYCCYGCSNLAKVVCKATTVPSLYSSFPANGDTLYVPEASISAYQNSDWGNQFTTIKLLENVIYYVSSNQATGSAVAQFTDTTKNRYNSVTGEGVLYMLPTTYWLPQDVFSGDSGLTEVDLTDSGLTTVGGSAFNGCTSLGVVQLPDNLASIGEVAFRNCSGIYSIVLPSTIDRINNYAFEGCSNLTSVTCYATTPPTLGYNPFPATNDTLQVPAASVSAYQSDSSWSAAFSTITAIS